MNVTVRVTNNRFDSRLEIPDSTRPANCNIWLELRLLLVQVNGTTFTRNNSTYRTQAWDSGEWNRFRYLYKHICEHWWSHQFWYRPPASFNDMNLPLARPTHRPNFQCRLRIYLVQNATERRHARIRCVRLADDERAMRSHSRLYDNRDILLSRPRGVPHITAVHEVGHLLRLAHPGVREGVAECQADGNASVCYEPHTEAMGAGLEMIDAYASPWLQRLAQQTHTAEADWTLFRQAVSPVSLSRERVLHDAARGSGRRMRDRLLQSTDQI